MAHSSPHHGNGFNGNSNGHHSSTAATEEELDARGRQNEKKKDFFGSLRKK